MSRPSMIVSGGQTGADRGALDAAIELGVAHGGWAPKGRRAEDGTIPARYALRELASPAYAARTERNVVDSDATLLVTRGAPTGGSALTATLARRHGRPLLHLDLRATRGIAAAGAVRGFLAAHRIGRLNVAGPRASHAPGIADEVRRLLIAALGGRLQVGAHTSIAGGLHRALERGAASGCDVVQIFTRSNQQWAAPPLAESAVARWEGARASNVVPAMAHGCYLCNLATGDRALREKSYRALELEALRTARLGIPYLVIHPGAHGGAGERRGLARIAAQLDRLHAEQPGLSTRILLENTAGQGTSLGWRFEHLRDLFAAVRAPERLGVCIDTCHTVAAGYDVRTPDGWDATFEEFDRLVGVAAIRAFHVNDSKAPLGGRVDRHQHLGHGAVGLDAFRCLVNDPRFVGLPMVIETPKPTGEADAINLGVLRALAGRDRVGRRARALAAKLATCAPASSGSPPRRASRSGR